MIPLGFCGKHIIKLHPLVCCCLESEEVMPHDLDQAARSPTRCWRTAKKSLKDIPSRWEGVLTSPSLTLFHFCVAAPGLELQARSPAAQHLADFMCMFLQGADHLPKPSGGPGGRGPACREGWGPGAPPGEAGPPWHLGLFEHPPRKTGPEA